MVQNFGRNIYYPWGLSQYCGGTFQDRSPFRFLLVYISLGIWWCTKDILKIVGSMPSCSTDPISDHSVQKRRCTRLNTQGIVRFKRILQNSILARLLDVPGSLNSAHLAIEVPLLATYSTSQSTIILPSPKPFGSTVWKTLGLTSMSYSPQPSHVSTILAWVVVPVAGL